MRTKTLIFALSFIFLFSFVLVQRAKAVDEYSPFAPVFINAAPNMEPFIEEKLPTYLKKWPKLSAEATLYEKFQLMLKIWQWSGSYYDYQHLATDQDGIAFFVKVPNRHSEFPITLSEYRWENGKIFHYRKDGRFEITPTELEKLKFSWANKLVESAEFLANFVNPRPGIVAEHEKVLLEYGPLTEAGTLEQKLAELKTPIPADELMFIPPKFTLNHYAPKRVIIKPMEEALGMCLVDAGVVFYHPLALLHDYHHLDDTTTHELLHRNVHLQGLLLNTLFDPEIWTSFLERHGGGFTFMFHPYQASIRKLAKVITSFDTEQARQEMIPAAAGNVLFMNKENIGLWNTYLRAGEKIRGEFRQTMFNSFIHHFYAKPLFWACVNDEMYDQNGSVKTFLYSRYAFTLLGGSEPNEKLAAKKTLLWLREHEEVIKEAYEKAKRVVEGKKEEDKEKQSGHSRALGDYRGLSRGMALSLAKLCARTVGLPYISDDQVIRDVKTLIDMGVISLPQVNVMEYLMKGVDHEDLF